MPLRQATIQRETRETRIAASLTLEGSGSADITTGIGFLDHMLESFTKHGGFDLQLKAEGDLHVDFHHTTEDTGIVIGQALRQALGERKGIRRFASFTVPMDEALSQASIDISGRPFTVWRVGFSKPKIGEMDTELFEEWFRAFAGNGGLTLHVENHYGSNNHHIIESCFKATARALRQAVEIDPRFADSVPSTKGMLEA